ncbi:MULTISPECIES: helix-turn-helix transcriptional regulator [Mameliella]|uniref:helix-turn-helix transcriptional regulator n=1 Tax=Mameliella TaxID=1434019 RepID=UPI0005B893F5|nr:MULTISPECIES: helix-turn-helix transcriptional regulator [Mameliella]MDD9732191.1 helix-turn-helix transcriptional regulator [Mameliella sp. AT18]ODM48863.1 transcriptional regulator [Ruegeria sp. PBVC088]
MTGPARGAEEADPAALYRLVGDRVRAARKSSGLTRQDLAELSGVSPRYLAKLEGGDGNISIGLLKRVALVLGRPMAELLAEEDPLAPDLAQLSLLYRNACGATREQVFRVLDPGRLRAQKAERICLVGLRGAGKSTLGARIGADLGLPFVEMNAEIERSAGMAVSEIIALYGAEGYRQIEAEALDRLLATQSRIVLAASGGIVEEPQTFERTLAGFHTIWVKAAPGDHMDRVRAQGDTRPMAGNPQAMLQLREILKAREASYRKAEHHLDTSGRSVEQSLQDLRGLIAAQGLLAGQGG